MRTIRTVAAQLEELRRGNAEFKAQIAQLKAQLAQLIGGGNPASCLVLPRLAGVRQKLFLDASGMNERKFYRLRASGQIRCVNIADRQVFVVMSSYDDYIAELDAEQNGPDGTPRPVTNPPPPAPRRRKEEELGSLTAALPPNTGPPPVA
jgi:hypothetical protein